MVSHTESRTVALLQKNVALKAVNVRHPCLRVLIMGHKWAVAAMAAKERETVLVGNIWRCTRRAEAHISQECKIMLDGCP